MRIKNFEEIESWKRARELTKLIYKISSICNFSKDKILTAQIRKAAISVMSNIAEGFDSAFTNEFARFLAIARRSASEVQSQLYIALDQSYINQAEFDMLYTEAETVRKLITGFIKYLKGLK